MHNERGVALHVGWSHLSSLPRQPVTVVEPPRTATRTAQHQDPKRAEAAHAPGPCAKELCSLTCLTFVLTFPCQWLVNERKSA
jgi:hypothetical protein